MIIKYTRRSNDPSSFLYVTMSKDCPHGYKCKVYSLNCQDCSFFGGVEEKNETIICNKKEGNNE